MSALLCVVFRLVIQEDLGFTVGLQFSKTTILQYVQSADLKIGTIHRLAKHRQYLLMADVNSQVKYSLQAEKRKKNFSLMRKKLTAWVKAVHGRCR